MGGNQDEPTPHWLRLVQVLGKPVSVEMEVRENDATASVDNREPRRSTCSVVFHEGRKRRAGRWIVMTESDRKLILELIHAQLLNGVLMRSFEDGLDHCESNALGTQRAIQLLQRRKTMRMATTTPMLEGKQNFRAGPEIRQIERSDNVSSISANPFLHPQFGALCRFVWNAPASFR